MCGRKLGGLPDVQEANARVVIEAGSRVTRALTQLQIREQVLRAPRVGQTQESQHWFKMKSQHKKAVTKGVYVAGVKKNITPVVRTEGTKTRSSVKKLKSRVAQETSCRNGIMQSKLRKKTTPTTSPELHVSVFTAESS